MKGVIASFRRARTTQYDNQMIIVVDGVEKRDAASKLVGKAIVWKSPREKEINGKVASCHGNKGAIRAIFEKGLPGQSLGTTVEIE